ncbi:MAG: hypothetical protein MMC23_007091 [Stictis urceolatum]|nr:hypothetical protein [Stictis urceolata]
MAQAPASEFPPPSLKTLAAEVSVLLKSRSETVCIAETAAGGLISSTLLSLPGASKFYAGGLTLYTLPSRIAFAGWTQDSVKGYNGPTPDVVKGLAENVRGKLGATWCLSESGTAGPTRSGEGRNRTPGYVALAVAGESGTVTREVDTGLEDRERNMVEFARAGLDLLKDCLGKAQKL